MKVKIDNIELNFSNICGADCFICSKHHGDLNSKLMHSNIFIFVKDQLKEIDFKRIHTSGNGDALMNPHYFKYLRSLRGNFPHATLDFYSNFSMMTPDKSDQFLNGPLVNEMHLRWDSLEPWIFNRSTGLDFASVLDNLLYFLKNNTEIKVFINYANIRRYYERVRDTLGVGIQPRYSCFTPDEINVMEDEYERIKDYFGQFSSNITFSNVSYTLWAERIEAFEDHSECCPKIGVLQNTIWICPDGSVSICPYDDRQRDLVYGNIVDKSIAEIWNSQERKTLLDKIKNNEIKTYPCVNPKLCCQMV